METIGGLVPTGRRLRGPASELVELDSPKGLKHTAIVFNPEYRDHNGINDALAVVLGFLESPMVTGIVELVEHDRANGAFVYPTGQVWSIAEVVRYFADKGEVAGTRSALELMYEAGRILVDAAETGESQGVYSHGGMTPHRVMLQKNGGVQIIGYALPQVEILAFHEDSSRKPREDSFRYCPPERMVAQPEDLSSDLFALGLIAFELITGKPIYDGLVDDIRQQAARGEGSKRLFRFRDQISPGVRDLLTRTLKPDQRDRWPDGNTFLDAVSRCLSGPEAEGPSLVELLSMVSSQVQRTGKPVNAASTMMGSREDFRAALGGEEAGPSEPVHTAWKPPPRRGVVETTPATPPPAGVVSSPPPANPPPASPAELPGLEGSGNRRPGVRRASPSSAAALAASDNRNQVQATEAPSRWGAAPQRVVGAAAGGTPSSPSLGSPEVADPDAVMAALRASASRGARPPVRSRVEGEAPAPPALPVAPPVVVEATPTAHPPAPNDLLAAIRASASFKRSELGNSASMAQRILGELSESGGRGAAKGPETEAPAPRPGRRLPPRLAAEGGENTPAGAPIQAPQPNIQPAPPALPSPAPPAFPPPSAQAPAPPAFPAPSAQAPAPPAFPPPSAQAPAPPSFPPPAPPIPAPPSFSPNRATNTPTSIAGSAAPPPPPFPPPMGGPSAGANPASIQAKNGPWQEPAAAPAAPAPPAIAPWSPAPPPDLGGGIAGERPGAPARELRSPESAPAPGLTRGSSSPPGLPPLPQSTGPSTTPPSGPPPMPPLGAGLPIAAGPSPDRLARDGRSDPQLRGMAPDSVRVAPAAAPPPMPPTGEGPTGGPARIERPTPEPAAPRGPAGERGAGERPRAEAQKPEPAGNETPGGGPSTSRGLPIGTGAKPPAEDSDAFEELDGSTRMLPRAAMAEKAAAVRGEALRAPADIPRASAPARVAPEPLRTNPDQPSGPPTRPIGGTSPAATLAGPSEPPRAEPPRTENPRAETPKGEPSKVENRAEGGAPRATEAAKPEAKHGEAPRPEGSPHRNPGKTRMERTPDPLIGAGGGAAAAFAIRRGPGGKLTRMRLPSGASAAEAVSWMIGNLVPIKLSATGHLVGWYRLFGPKGRVPPLSLMGQLDASQELTLEMVPNDSQLRLVEVPEVDARMMTPVGSAVPLASLADHLASMFDLPPGNRQVEVEGAELNAWSILADLPDGMEGRSIRLVRIEGAEG